MGKNKKKGPNANVFKVAGAKSLKKTKAKAVNLGLKNIKQKVANIDKQFINLKKDSKPKEHNQSKEINLPQKRTEKPVSKEEIIKTSEQIIKINLL